MEDNKPKIFIASPLFNTAQHEILDQIESILEQHDYTYYSARKHSGSDLLTPEQRKDINAWNPVFDSNRQGLDECRVCIAVLEYAYPEGTTLCVVKNSVAMQVELPDAGTVWETGYLHAQGKLVLGFHTTKQAKHLNLMLTHGCDGLLTGYGSLHSFLGGPKSLQDVAIPERVHKRLLRVPGQAFYDAYRFNWTATQPWGKDVE